MLLRANNSTRYMRSKLWCFCLSLLFSSLSNKIAHTAASTLRRTLFTSLQRRPDFATGCLRTPTAPVITQFHFIKKKTNQPAAFQDGSAKTSHLAELRSLTLAVDDVDEDVDDDDGARPADACAVGTSGSGQTHTTTRSRGSLEFKVEPPRICWCFFYRLVRNAVWCRGEVGRTASTITS